MDNKLYNELFLAARAAVMGEPDAMPELFKVVCRHEDELSVDNMWDDTTDVDLFPLFGDN